MVIALIPQHAQKIRPPRALSVPFPLGRPLGLPGDKNFQIDILRAALGLLTKDSVNAVFETWEVDVPGIEGEEQGWSCPVNFAKDRNGDTSREDRLLEEIRLLHPWYDRSLRERGSTTFGVSHISIEEIPGFLVQFIESPGHEKGSDDMSLSDMLKYAAEDLKAFYNEVATIQPGNASAKEIEEWYWNECEAGKLIRDIRTICQQHPDKRVTTIAGFTLVPHTQLGKDTE